MDNSNKGLENKGEPGSSSEKVVSVGKEVATSEAVAEFGVQRKVDQLLTLKQRLQVLRESHEVVEVDSEMNDIFMLVRSGVVLNRANFLSTFPNKRAIVITQEQLLAVEDCVHAQAGSEDNYFVYIKADGKKTGIQAEEMDDPLVLFIEDLGD
jgi:hypothetical protein